MAETLFNSRIILAHDTQARWSAASFVPRKGEIIIYDADATNKMARIKIGNGIDLVKNLPFVTDITDIASALKALKYEGASSNSTATQFITQVTQADGLVSATKASIPTAGSSLGMVKSGGDVTINNGTITVNDDSHKHTSATISDLSDNIDDAISDAIAALDANDPTASGTSTTFISTISETDGIIKATKASIPTANGTTLGMVKNGGDVTISNGVITVSDDSHNHVISNVDGLQAALDAKATPANITSAIQALDYTGATASGDATQFITQVTQSDGVVSATKASIPIATSSQAGLVKSGTDIIVDSSGNVSVVNNSHNHTSANISDLSTTISNAVTSAIGALDAADPAANGTATQFITSISQKDGVITATKANITAAALGLSGAMKFLGTSATAITDGATINPITIGSTSTTVASGNVVLYGSKEFVWNGSAWEELGNEGSYKVQQNAVSSPSASGNAISFIDTISQNAQGVITATKKTIPTGNGTTAGITIVYPAQQCTTYTSDSGTVTPAAVKKAVEMFGVLNTGDSISGNLIFSNPDATGQSQHPNLTWNAIGANTPYIGYASDQSDGTFILGSIKGTKYATGLAIGGGSGNLLWKGVKVATVTDLPSTATQSAAGLMSASDKKKLDELATVATTGKYSDLIDIPDEILTISDAEIDTICV